MRRLGIVIFLFFLAAVLVLLFLKDRFPLREEEVEGSEYEVVRYFPFSSPAGLEGWDRKLLGQKKTEYLVAEHEGLNCLKAISEDSASALYYKQPLSHERDPFVSWDWKAEEFPELGSEEDLQDKEVFDFAAQVYVVFHARFFLNMKAIQYVWCREIPVGRSAVSPYTENVRIMVLQSGPSEIWKHERRDLKKDYLELFGEELTVDVEAVSVMTDSDSTDSSASAYYKDITLGYTGGVEHVIESSGGSQRRLELPSLPRIPLLRKRER
ncbi:MAG: DUF3047 domain-containing protein [Candidatus Omnitrophica bacterium]|nr:DUF3047 domain-containing protein [Candidatus Omnitrophota bacterium]